MTLYTDDKQAVKSAIVKSSQKTAALDLPAGASGEIEALGPAARGTRPPAAAGLVQAGAGVNARSADATAATKRAADAYQ